MTYLLPAIGAGFSLGVIVAVVAFVVAWKLFLHVFSEPLDDLPDDFSEQNWPAAANDPEPDYDPAA